MNDATLSGWLDRSRPLVESALKDALARCTAKVPPTLAEAMGYSLLAGGKRLRPLLALAAADAFGVPFEGPVKDFACAVEFVHTYSLIHDDLPAMDDDDLRRGRPTSHKVFGEAMAILAGDALLTEAFWLCAEGREPVRGRLCAILSAAAGARGMVGGQVDDIREDPERTVEALADLHGRKTGALLAAAIAGGGAAAGASEADIAALHAFGLHLGLAFQIRDDVLDVQGDPSKMGKSGGTDARKGKVTYVSRLGLDGSMELARREARAAEEAIRHLARPERLAALARYAVERDR